MVYGLWLLRSSCRRIIFVYPELPTVSFVLISIHVRHYHLLRIDLGVQVCAATKMNSYSAAGNQKIPS